MRVFRRFKTPSPAMVVACLALIVALSGAAYAAANLPPNSVGTAQLKDGAVTSTKVLKEGLTLSDLGAASKAERITLNAPVNSVITVGAGACVNDTLGEVETTQVNPVGGMVIGTLTNSSGGPAVGGAVALVPTMLIPTSPNLAAINLVLCNNGTNPVAIGAGSVFHIRVIFP